jgi:hypothetical protein
MKMKSDLMERIAVVIDNPYYKSQPNWEFNMACINDPDILFIGAIKIRSNKKAMVALALCETCPAVLGCLADAFADGADADNDGIRGGMLASERRAIAESRQQSAAVELADDVRDIAC